MNNARNGRRLIGMSIPNMTIVDDLQREWGFAYRTQAVNEILKKYDELTDEYGLKDPYYFTIFSGCKAYNQCTLWGENIDHAFSIGVGYQTFNDVFTSILYKLHENKVITLPESWLEENMKYKLDNKRKKLSELIYENQDKIKEMLCHQGEGK